MLLHLERIDEKRISENPNIGGNIYLQIGEAYFPEENWYDHASLMLEQWIPAILSFAHQSTDVCKLTFYDGPCYIVLQRKVDAVITVACVYDQKTVIEQTMIDFPLFLRSVVKAGNKFCRLLHLQRVDHSQISALLQKLKQEIRTVRELGPYEE